MKLPKNLPKKSRLQDLSDSDVDLSSCEQSDSSGRDADSAAELGVFVESKYNPHVKLSKTLL